MENNTLKLIDGTFERDKARTLLISLFNHKINFHESQRFSDQIRYGQDRENSDNRIQELMKEKQEMISWINSLEDAELINIHCDIEMKIIKT